MEEPLAEVKRRTFQKVLRPHYRNIGDSDLVMSLALLVCLHISQVACMSIFTIRQTMLVAFRVIMAPCAHAVRGRAIAILMDVESMLWAGRESLDVGDYFHRVAILGEAHHTTALLTGCRV